MTPTTTASKTTTAKTTAKKATTAKTRSLKTKIKAAEPTPKKEAPSYSFPAIRGIQSRREYFTVMIPIRLLTKLFVLETEEMPAEMRAQRQPNNTRIKKLAAYVLEKEYVLSSVTVTVELTEAYDYFQFEQVQEDLGLLKIPMDSKMLIADGQHRIYALQRALKEDPDLGDETISCVIFLDFGLDRRQQIFHDLNNYVSKPTKSLNLLYDHRSDGAEIARNVMNGAIIFRGRTDAEKTSLAAKSLKAFTFNAIDEAVNKWMHPGKDNGLSAAQMSKRAIEFFKEVTKHIPEWQWLIDKEIAPGELRAASLSCNAVR